MSLIIRITEESLEQKCDVFLTEPRAPYLAQPPVYRCVKCREVIDATKLPMMHPCTPLPPQERPGGDGGSYGGPGDGV